MRHAALPEVLRRSAAQAGGGSLTRQPTGADFVTAGPISFTLIRRGSRNMDVTVHIPDDIAARLASAGGDLSRRALEGLALEEYKSDHITKAELRRLLGFGTRYRLDGFLKAHNVFDKYTMEDFEQDREDLRRLGF
jgi:hypothetical protein